jgi:hypothetical protein
VSCAAVGGSWDSPLLVSSYAAVTSITGICGLTPDEVTLGSTMLAQEDARNAAVARVCPQRASLNAQEPLTGRSRGRIVRSEMNSVVIVRTASGSSYVLSISEPGVHWCRLPSTKRGLEWTASGWEEVVPRIVRGQRLLIGNLRTSPVTDIEVVPA